MPELTIEPAAEYGPQELDVGRFAYGDADDLPDPESFSADLADDNLIVDFCRTVGSVDNLQRLYLLTYADMRAVGPGVFNNWRDSLLGELYVRAREFFELGRWAVIVENHYGRPMDMEWAKDGETGALSMVQARPETVQSANTSAPLRIYRLEQTGRRLLSGAAIGQAIAAGRACVIRSASR